MTEHTAASKRTPVNKPTSHRTIIYNSNPKTNLGKQAFETDGG